MILTSMFYGDEKQNVMLIQEDSYYFIASDFYQRIFEKYMYARRLFQINKGSSLPLVNPLVTHPSDYSSLVDVYNFIAAYFRFKECPHGSLFPFEFCTDDTLREWYQFAEKEIEELLKDPFFTRHIIIACGQPTTVLGKESKVNIIATLEDRYSDMVNTKPPVLQEYQYGQDELENNLMPTETPLLEITVNGKRKLSLKKSNLRKLKSYMKTVNKGNGKPE